MKTDLCNELRLLSDCAVGAVLSAVCVVVGMS